MASGGVAVIHGRRTWVRRVEIWFVVLTAAVVMTLALPLSQERRLTHRCAGLGGQLGRSTEDVEPVAVGRTVYTCYGPGGQVLDGW